MLITVIFITYFAKLKFWILVAQPNLETTGGAQSSLKHYKICQIINQIGFSCLLTSIFPAFNAGGHAFTTIIFVSLAERSSGMNLDVKLNMFGAMLGIVAGIHAIIKFCGDILDVSQQTKKAFSKHMLRKELKKQILACRDIRIYCSPVFYMKKRTLTVFLTSMITNTITIILAT